MSNYSGSTSIDFEIERYKHKETGALFTLDQVQDEDDNLEYKVFPLTVEGSSYYQAGRHFGPPEKCYPDEGDTEITSVIGPDGKDWSDVLTKEENDSLLELINEAVQDVEPDFDDYEPDFDYGDY